MDLVPDVYVEVGVFELPGESDATAHASSSTPSLAVALSSTENRVSRSSATSVVNVTRVTSLTGMYLVLPKSFETNKHSLRT